MVVVGTATRSGTMGAYKKEIVTTSLAAKLSSRGHGGLKKNEDDGACLKFWRGPFCNGYFWLMGPATGKPLEQVMYG